MPVPNPKELEMFAVLLISFVVVCILALCLRELWLRRKAEVEWLEEQIEEDIEAGILPAYIYDGPRMDIPRRRPMLRTRHSK